MSTFDSKAIIHNTQHSNWELADKSYWAWTQVTVLPWNRARFIEECERIRAGVIEWLDKYPKRKSQYAECAGIRIECRRRENGTYGTQIYLTTCYSLDP